MIGGVEVASKNGMMVADESTAPFIKNYSPMDESSSNLCVAHFEKPG